MIQTPASPRTQPLLRPRRHTLGTFLFAGAALLLLTAAPAASARDWYVSAAKGKGKKGTKVKPAKDLGNIIKKLKAGDVVHIAAGTYYGKGKNGGDEIKVPVSIIGGYDESFTKRDPWGTLRTILTGDNKTKNYKVSPRLGITVGPLKTKSKEKTKMPPIVVDGLIIDQGGQNRYKTEKNHMIVRKASPSTGQMPTPDRGALVVSVSKTGMFDPSTWDITVKNCVILNAAPTKGVLMVRGYRNTVVRITNNVVVNNTGSGIYASTSYHPRDNKDHPKFTIDNNTVLFTWKYDGMSTSFSGNAFETDSDTNVTATNNVFAFSDRFGIEAHSRVPLFLKNNLITGSLSNDFWETPTDATMSVDDMEDEAEFLNEDSEDNVNKPIKIPVSKEWAQLYANRIVINRDKIEANVKVKNNGANALRSMLGLPVQAGKVDSPKVSVFLPRISVDDAIAAGTKKYDGKGASKAAVK